jgi:hypothetical protein
MENLEQALSFANYQTTLTHQRKLLTQKFQESSVIAYNGGLFKLTLEFIGAVKLFQPPYVLDSNGTPVKIEDYETFIAEIEEAYKKAVESYGKEFSALRLKRNVKSLVEL